MQATSETGTGEVKLELVLRATINPTQLINARRMPSNETRPQQPAASTVMMTAAERVKAANQYRQQPTASSGGVQGGANPEEQKKQMLAAQENRQMEGNGFSNPYGAQGKKSLMGNGGGLISSRNLGGVSQDSQSIGNSKSHNTATGGISTNNGQVMMKRTTRRYQSTDKYAPPSISSLAGNGANGHNTQRAQIVTNANQKAAAIQ